MVINATSKQIQERARTSEIFARKHLAIDLTIASNKDIFYYTQRVLLQL